jgi:protein gp37
MSDLFHQDVPDEYIADVFAVMAQVPQHTFQILTKRHARMRSLLSSPRWSELLTRDPNVWPSDLDPELPLPNVWLGVSVEDQKWANIRVPALLDTPAAVRFISAEPLLGPVQFGHDLAGIDWVIVGGESGPGARPMHPDWALTIRDDCETNDVAFLFKQWGNRDATGKRTSKKAAGRELDGRTWDEYPEATG